MRLDGKAALVTGAGRGLGAAIARRFAQEGASIVCADRDAVRRRLTDAGIPTAIYYATPLHQQPAFADGRSEGGDACPVSERTSEQILALPMHPYLQPEQIQRIAAVVRGDQP